MKPCTTCPCGIYLNRERACSCAEKENYDNGFRDAIKQIYRYLDNNYEKTTEIDRILDKLNRMRNKYDNS